jgi:hypothetical protein
MKEEDVDKIAVMLQPIAGLLADMFEGMTGEPVGFALIVSTNKVGQYVSNCKRPEMMEMLQEILSRFKQGKADIPAHYNPDLTDKGE